jgi:2-dehydro-3-deoxy-D-gluconate 5-dehydrogenase
MSLETHATRAESMFGLGGRCALVTGASRGLGRAIALALAGAGADVVCASSQSGGACDTAQSIRSLGREAWDLHADLSDRDALGALAAQAQDVSGGIDILVNNAGTITRHPAVDYSIDDWDTVLHTNLDATFLLCQQLARPMIARRSGKIINIASLLSFSGGIGVPAYAASKHAVAGLTKALANEWARSGIQVNAIAPGYFVTANTEPLRADAARERDITARIPAGRWGTPEDIGGAAVFLASRASDYVNGHVLVVDGGWMAR